MDTPILFINLPLGERKGHRGGILGQLTSGARVTRLGYSFSWIVRITDFLPSLAFWDFLISI